MSKLIESLKASAKEFSKKQTQENGGLEHKKTDYQLTQEQLADIYFSGGEKAKKSEYPMVIKVIEKPRVASVMPWIITSIAFLITAFSLFSTKRIFVDVKVIDERNPYFAYLQRGGEMTDAAAPSAATASAQKKEELSGERIPMQNFVFEGASRLKSSKNAKGLTLINSTVAPFARASLRFDKPLNLTTSKIVFYAKGHNGGENLALALKDKDNVLAFERGTTFPFPDNLTSDWQRAEIILQDVSKEFDARNVASMRFEFGSKDTKNKPGDTVFIKDLQVVPV